jgi:phage protein U
MDLRVLLTTFGVIFLTEMGDKGQLAAMTMAAQTKRPWCFYRRVPGAGFSLGAWCSGRKCDWRLCFTHLGEKGRSLHIYCYRNLDAR